MAQDLPPASEPANSCSFARAQSVEHSAHIEEDVEVHDRWHPLYGRRVRRLYSERRRGSQCVHMEASPGAVTAVAAWMLDPIACVGMSIGSPRVTVSALIELYLLLLERDFRRSSVVDSRIVRRTGMRRSSPRPLSTESGRVPRQLILALNPI
jgi:hypothetical protein